MRKVAAAALVSLIALLSTPARADADASDAGGDAPGVDVALDIAVDTTVDTMIDATDAEDTAVVDSFMDDTFVEDTTPADTFVPPADTAPEATADAMADAAKDTLVITVLDSAGPIIDHVNDGGWDPRGRPAEPGESCGCEVVGRRSDNALALLLPLLAVVLRRRRS
jgi:hypothetical protein